MKKMNQLMFAMLIIFSLSIALPSQAKIWRVNNRPGIAADFTTAQAANDGAIAGDTVFLEPSPNSYGSITFTKKIIMIGTGYFLSENPETQWKNNWPTRLESVNFGTSSDYSQLMGFMCQNSISVSSQHVIIKRNYIYGSVTFSSSNITFSGNYCSLPSGYSGFNMGNGNHDLVVENNIFLFSSSYYYYSPASIVGTVSYNGGFINNTIIGYYYNYGYPILNLDNFIVQNNITASCTFYQNTNDFTYNISDNANFGNLNGNQQNVNISTVITYTGSTDGQYQLKPLSPAIGAGFAGVDCGAFGGINPYVLSGLPPVPAIYDFFIGNTNSEVNVQLKVKSHN